MSLIGNFYFIIWHTLFCFSQLTDILSRVTFLPRAIQLCNGVYIVILVQVITSDLTIRSNSTNAAVVIGWFGIPDILVAHPNSPLIFPCCFSDLMPWKFPPAEGCIGQTRACLSEEAGRGLKFWRISPLYLSSWWFLCSILMGNLGELNLFYGFLHISRPRLHAWRP